MTKKELRHDVMSYISLQPRTMTELEILTNVSAPTIRNVIAGIRKQGKPIISKFMYGKYFYKFGTADEIEDQVKKLYERAYKELMSANGLLGWEQFKISDESFGSEEERDDW